MNTGVGAIIQPLTQSSKRKYGLSLCLWDDPANLIQPEAVECFRRGLQSDPNHAALQFYLGVAYREGGAMPKDYTQAAILWRKAAEQGNDVAQQALGVLYYHGEGVPKDYAEAARWYRKAADQGNLEAQYCIAEAYATGKGVPEDFEHAAVWYRKAANQGHGRAQRALDDLLRKMPDAEHEGMGPSR
jgi:TPR repeat protein